MSLPAWSPHDEHGSAVTGVMLILLGVLLMVVGGFGITVGQGIARFRTVAETTMPGTLRFETVEGARYGVALDQRFAEEENEVTATTCTVTHPNERRQEIRGSRASITAAGGITRFGTIEGQDGTTTLECGYTNGSIRTTVHLLVFRVIPWLQAVLYTAIGGGLLVTLLGAGLLFRRSGRDELQVVQEEAVREETPAGPPAGGGARDAVRWGLGQALSGWQQSLEQSSTAGSVSAGTATAAPLDIRTVPPVMGVSFDAYVHAEVGLRRDRVAPADTDAYLVGLGIAPGTWPQVRSGWQAAMARDWRVGAAFGQAVSDASKR